MVAQVNVHEGDGDPTPPLVLITGAAGFTGHHMVIEAARLGYRVRATDRSSRHYGPLFEALGAEFQTHDITQPDGWAPLLEGVDAIVHVAGIHDYSTPDRVMHAVNVEGVRNLCSAACEAGVERLIHISSVGVYGYDWHDKQPVSEDAPKLTPPLNNYNQTKWAGEQIVWEFAEKRGLKATTLLCPRSPVRRGAPVRSDQRQLLARRRGAAVHQGRRHRPAQRPHRGGAGYGQPGVPWPARGLPQALRDARPVDLWSGHRREGRPQQGAVAAVQPGLLPADRRRDPQRDRRLGRQGPHHGLGLLRRDDRDLDPQHDS